MVLIPLDLAPKEPGKLQYKKKITYFQKLMEQDFEDTTGLIDQIMSKKLKPTDMNQKKWFSDDIYEFKLVAKIEQVIDLEPHLYQEISRMSRLEKRRSRHQFVK